MLWKLFLGHLRPRPQRQAVSRHVLFGLAAEEAV